MKIPVWLLEKLLQECEQMQDELEQLTSNDKRPSWMGKKFDGFVRPKHALVKLIAEIGRKRKLAERYKPIRRYRAWQRRCKAVLKLASQTRVEEKDVA